MLISDLPVFHECEVPDWAIAHRGNVDGIEIVAISTKDYSKHISVKAELFSETNRKTIINSLRDALMIAEFGNEYLKFPRVKKQSEESGEPMTAEFQRIEHALEQYGA